MLLEKVKNLADSGALKARVKENEDLVDTDDDLIEEVKKDENKKMRFKFDLSAKAKDNEYLLQEVAARMEMDRVSEVKSLEEIGMADPFCTGKSVERVAGYIEKFDYKTHVYPKSIMDKIVQAFGNGGAI